jgi:uncharacterized protein (TIGR02996 family)
MNADELALLTEIEAAPRRLDRRFIYADRLEERADPRAEFIHVWHEMETLKPWSERYLDLFRIRQELRADIDKDWLRRLGYFHQHSPMFTELPPVSLATADAVSGIVVSPGHKGRSGPGRRTGIHRAATGIQAAGGAEGVVPVSDVDL